MEIITPSTNYLVTDRRYLARRRLFKKPLFTYLIKQFVVRTYADGRVKKEIVKVTDIKHQYIY